MIRAISRYAVLGRPTIRRVACLLPSLALILFCASCSDFWVSNSSIATVTVTPTALILKAGVGGSSPTPGDSYQLSASATDVGNDPPTDETSPATWTSSNTAVATVSEGKITVVGTAADGTATITGAFGGQSGSCTVLTYIGTAPTALNSITLPSGISTGSLTPSETFQLKVSADLSGNTTHDVSPYVTWVSSNTAVATVSTTGVVTVLSTATAGSQFTVTATANFASASAVSPALQFTVLSGVL